VTGSVIEVEHAGLAYRLSRNRVGTLKEFAIQSMKRQVRYEQFWALKDVSFSVEAGEIFAVIGPNGAGKSTLMKMIARVLPPTSGRVVVRGSVAPMIELGAGFNHELTAFENIVLYGSLLGRRPEVMRQRAPAIAEWAGLTEFVDVPIRSFSSGMLARLGFSVATDIQPDIVVVDEVLAVGDEAFQTKSTARFQSLIDSGTSVVLVSHDLDAVLELASRVMWLDRGTVRAIGPPNQTVAAYKAEAVAPHK
jgi:ABC-type polysaccharide/polyol phosphate transport system ATPase subunit